MELKDKTKITFHSGVLTIGGTIIEVATESSHIFFDFGTEFKPELKLKDDSIETLLENRLIPELNGIYDPDLNYHFSGDTNKKYDNTAIFISHCHLDHTRMLNYSNPQIPMYALKETKVLVESLNSKNTFLIPAVGKNKPMTRTIIPCDNLETIHVGDISVTLMRVDHDAYGACGMIITTPDMKIAYTGDLRLHGYDKQDTLDYCKTAFDADVLIIEGVSISFDRENEHERIETEQELIKQVVDIVTENPEKQITFNCYPGNVKRIAAIVENSPREVVLEASFAYILKECLNMNCKYYGNSDNLGLDESLRVSYDELLEDEGHYLWQVVDSYEKLKGGGVYIHSDAQPLGDFDPAYLPFIEALEKGEIKFMRIACSGHAYPEDLDRIVDLIQPKCLVPIHSYHPERLENKYGSRHLPVRGETI